MWKRHFWVSHSVSGSSLIYQVKQIENERFYYCFISDQQTDAGVEMSHDTGLYFVRIKVSFVYINNGVHKDRKWALIPELKYFRKQSVASAGFHFGDGKAKHLNNVTYIYNALFYMTDISMSHIFKDVRMKNFWWCLWRKPLLWVTLRISHNKT